MNIMTIKIVYRPLSERPDFVSNAIGQGYTTIHNAPRPLSGDVVDDSWNLPNVHGRHYAALKPGDVYYSDRLVANARYDAVEVRYVDDSKLESLGKSYYMLYLSGVPKWATITDLIDKGLEIVNRYELIEPEDDSKFGLDRYPITGE